MSASSVRPGLPSDLLSEIEAVGASPGVAPTREQWEKLLPRLADLLRRADSTPLDGTWPAELRAPMAVLDRSRLQEIADEAGPAIVLELSQIFLEDATQRIVELSQALACEDRASGLSLVHSIKGASGNFGALRMASLAEEIERRCKVGELSRAAELMPVLSTELELLRNLLKSKGLLSVASIRPGGESALSA